MCVYICAKCKIIWRWVCVHACMCALVCVHVCTWGIRNSYNDSRFMCNELDIVTE